MVVYIEKRNIEFNCSSIVVPFTGTKCNKFSKLTKLSRSLNHIVLSSTTLLEEFVFIIALKSNKDILFYIFVHNIIQLIYIAIAL